MKYCRNCGAELNENAAVCTKCGVFVGDGNKFCPNCGAEPDPLAVICVKCGCQLKPIRPNVTSVSMYERANRSCSDKSLHGREIYDYTHRNSAFIWAVKTCLLKYKTFSGRARRKEFWYWGLFLFLSQAVLLMLCASFYDYGNGESNAYYFFILLFGAWNISMLLPSLAVTVRRLHDTGHSGWYYLMVLIPLVGAIILLVEFCTDSDGFNKYGPSPKLSRF